MKKEDFIKYIGQIMHTKSILVILIIGAILLLLPNGTEKARPDGPEETTFEAYRTETERALKRILTKVKGAGEVEVFISLEDYGEVFYAMDGQGEESDDAGAKEFSNVYVLKNDAGGGESPLVLKNETPKIAGVLVVAKGAKNAQIKEQIISAVRAVTGVKAHRVEVLEKK